MTSLEKQITEIVYRATSKVLGTEAHGSRIEAVANPLSEALVDVVVTDGVSKREPFVEIETFLVWELWNQILDEIELEIPAASRIEVVLKDHASRSARRQYRDGVWRQRLNRPYQSK